MLRTVRLKTFMSLYPARVRSEVRGGVGPPSPFSSRELSRGLRDERALILGAVQFDLAGLAFAFGAGDRGGAIGSPADDLVERHLSGVAVGQADDHEAEVHEIGYDRDQRHLISAVLRSARRECAPDLANHGAAHPKSAGLLPEASHRRRHPAKAGRRPDDDRVVIRKFARRRDWSGLIELEMRSLRDRLGGVFRHPFDVDGGAGLTRAFGDRISHFLDVAVAGIIQYENLGHFNLLRVLAFV